MLIEGQHTEEELLHSLVDVVHRNVDLAFLHLRLRLSHLLASGYLSTIIDGLLHAYHAACHIVLHVESHLLHLLVGIDDVGEGVCTGLHVHLWQPSLGGIAHIIVSQGLHHAILLDGRIVVVCHLLAFVQGQ